MSTTVSAIDLFCGAGGLSLGLKRAGIRVKAGIDLDPACSYPYEQNIKAEFLHRDICDVTGADLEKYWRRSRYRLLAGCAPCQPFSSHRRGQDTSEEGGWNLLGEFSRLVGETEPHFVTMENVTRLAKMEVFDEFVSFLRNKDYQVEYGSLYGPEFGLPQERRRLVLIASRVGDFEFPKGTVPKDSFKTVKQTISDLPRLESGESDADDPLHSARRLTEINLARVKASQPGGTWEDWPEELRAPCHRRSSGGSFKSFYGRMSWNAPSPTITTQSYNPGTGRFGHPEQDRTITLREAAMLQGFPQSYQFVPPMEKPTRKNVGRLIGNAVPPAFGLAVGRAILHSIS